MKINNIFAFNLKSNNLHFGQKNPKCKSSDEFYKVSPLNPSDSDKFVHSNKTPLLTLSSDIDEYVDDRIFGFDGSILCKKTRNEIREDILSKSMLNDHALKIKNLDEELQGENQLPKTSKYYILGNPLYNKKSQSFKYPFPFLKEMPDFNGLRGKTPLSGKKAEALKFRLIAMKKTGIDTIIDLRAKGECSPIARKLMDEMDIHYVNFQVQDGYWNKNSLEEITHYFEAINKGDFFVGCANGQARTDLAVAINYILNPKSINMPQLYFGNKGSAGVSIKKNIRQILKLLENNKDFVKNWGWENYEEFLLKSNKKIISLLGNI